MKIQPLDLPGLLELDSPELTDDRGGLRRVFDREPFEVAGLPTRWEQLLLSRTSEPGIVRGMHVQVAPYTEAKLLVPVAGRMAWAVVDLRRDTPSFGRSSLVELSAERGRALFVPRGFAHGCMSLARDTLIAILTDNRHSAEHGRGFRWDDPALAIAWPATAAAPRCSAAHAALPSFADFLLGDHRFEV